MDYLIMFVIIAILVFLITYKAKYYEDGNVTFFDFDNTKAMRGIWSLVVILVHIPDIYQNPIQDMIGSFAYVGVTFFFMTSAYGLIGGVYKNPNSINMFWRKRLPKLIIPNYLINIVFALFVVICGEAYDIRNIFYLNGWVIWLLGCYVVFWISCKLNRKERNNICTISGSICIISLLIYCLRNVGIINTSTWCPEVIGFIWGILLCSKKGEIKSFMTQKWKSKVFISMFVSLVLGVCYLKFKYITFWGDYILKILLGLAILCFILVLNSKIQIGNAIVGFLGDISYEIYLLHSFVFQIVSAIVPKVSSGYFILISIVLTILISAIIHTVCQICFEKINALMNKKYN